MTRQDKFDILTIIFLWVIPCGSMILSLITNNMIISYVVVGYILAGILFFVCKVLFCTASILTGLFRWSKRQS